MTRPWFLRRLVGDARRHAAVWLTLGAAFAAVGFCAAGARLAVGNAAASSAPAVEEPARVIAYLTNDGGERGASELSAVLSKLPGVERVTIVAPHEGLERLRRELGERAALLEGVGPDLLLPSLEIEARPAAASALAFRLRRLSGISDVDLVLAPTAAPAAAAARAGLDRARASVGPLAVGGVAALLALVAAVALLRARLRPELGVLFMLGVTRATAARPALALATVAGGIGGALGVLVASSATRAWLGAAGLPGRESALGVAALVLLALASAAGAVSGREAAHAA